MKRRESATAVLALALALLVIASACSKSTNSTNTTNTSNSGKTTPGTATMSPTEVVNAYLDAAAKKDIASIKKYMSQSTLRKMEDEAKKEGKTLDQALQESAAIQGDSSSEKPKVSNEKVSGDTATVDLTIEGKSIAMPLVKEGGEWKIAMDKFMERMLNDMKNAAPKEGGDTGGMNDNDSDNDNHEH